MKTLDDAYAVFQNPYATYDDMQAAQSFIEANESLAPVRGLITPEEGYTYGDIVPLRTNQATGERELTVPMFAREGAQSLLNIAEGTQTGVVNPEDVMNVMPMGGAASLLDEGIEGGFSAGMFIGRNNPRFNEESLKVARDLRAQGDSNRRIFEETGDQTGTATFFGRDDQPRQEISDSNKINFGYIGNVLGGIGPDKPHYAPMLDLEDTTFISDPDYLRMISGRTEAVPSVKLMSHDEAMKELGTLGSFDPDTLQIKLNPYRNDPSTEGGYAKRTPDEIRSTLLHELQHKIQGDDDLSLGTNSGRSMEGAKDFVNKAMYVLKDQKDLVEADRAKLKDFRKAERVDQLYEDSQRLRNSSDPLTVETARKTIEAHKEYPEFRAAYQQMAGKPPKDGTPENREWWAGLSAYMADGIRDTISYSMALNADRDVARTMANIAYERAYGKPSDKLNQMRDIVSTIKQFKRDALNPNSSQDPAYTLYRRKLGEVEARATQRRENLADRDRARLFPEDIYDVDPQSVYFEPKYVTPESLLGMGVKRN